MASGKKKGRAAVAAGALPFPFDSTRKEFRAALENSAEVLRRALSESQQSIAGQLKAGQLGQAPPDAALGALQQALGVAFRQTQELLNNMERAVQEAQAAAKAAAPPPAPPAQAAQATAPQAAPPPAPPAPNAPPAATPVDPIEATNALMAQAVVSLNDAMKAATHTIDMQPGKAGAWEAGPSRERPGQK